MYDLEGNFDNFYLKPAKGVNGKVPWVASPERQRGLWSFLTWSFILAQIVAAEQFITSAAAASESIADNASAEADGVVGRGAVALAAQEDVATSNENGVNGQVAQLRATTDAPPANWAQDADAGTMGGDAISGAGAEAGGSTGAAGGAGISSGNAADIVAQSGEQPGNGNADPIPPIDGETPSLGDVPDLLDPVVDLVGVVPDLLDPVVDLIGSVPDLLDPVVDLVGTVPDILNPVTTLVASVPDVLDPIVDLIGTTPELLEPIASLVGEVPELLSPVLNAAPTVLNPVTELAENTFDELGDIVGSGVVPLTGVMGVLSNQTDMLFDGAERTDFNIALLTSSGDEDLGQASSLGGVVDTVISDLTTQDHVPDGDAGHSEDGNLFSSVSHGVTDTVSSLSTNLFG